MREFSQGSILDTTRCILLTEWSTDNGNPNWRQVPEHFVIFWFRRACWRQAFVFLFCHFPESKLTRTLSQNNCNQIILLKGQGWTLFNRKPEARRCDRVCQFRKKLFDFFFALTFKFCWHHILFDWKGSVTPRARRSIFLHPSKPLGSHNELVVF